MGGLAALAAVIVVAVVVAVLAAGWGGGGAPPVAGQPAQDRPGPVLLVPGYGGSTGSLSVLARRIRAAGRQATVLHLPGNGTEPGRRRRVLNTAVNRALRGGAPSVDVIGYSAGGVTALLWAREDGGTHKARRVITLGSPFHGTQLASAAEAFVPGACPAACQQLVPGSKLLSRLDATAVPRRPRWLSLWTTDDRTVTPPDSARLAGALNVPIQAVCPAVQVSHSQLPTSPAVTAMVLQALAAPRPGPTRRPASDSPGLGLLAARPSGRPGSFIGPPSGVTARETPPPAAPAPLPGPMIPAPGSHALMLPAGHQPLHRRLFRDQLLRPRRNQEMANAGMIPAGDIPANVHYLIKGYIRGSRRCTNGGARVWLANHCAPAIAPLPSCPAFAAHASHLLPHGSHPARSSVHMPRA